MPVKTWEISRSEFLAISVLHMHCVCEDIEEEEGKGRKENKQNNKRRERGNNEEETVIEKTRLLLPVYTQMVTSSLQT
jgi:hypothetical protein